MIRFHHRSNVSNHIKIIFCVRVVHRFVLQISPKKLAGVAGGIRERRATAEPRGNSGEAASELTGFVFTNLLTASPLALKASLPTSYQHKSTRARNPASYAGYHLEETGTKLPFSVAFAIERSRNCACFCAFRHLVFENQSVFGHNINRLFYSCGLLIAFFQIL